MEPPDPSHYENGRAKGSAELDPPDDDDADDAHSSDYDYFDPTNANTNTNTNTTTKTTTYHNGERSHDPDASYGNDDDHADEDALDLEDVNRMASEEEYELVYFSKDERMISFEPAAVTSDERRDRNDDDDDERARIDVYWTSGTVGTRFLRRPSARGDAQRSRRSAAAAAPNNNRRLILRNVGLRKLREIFRDPRARAEGVLEAPSSSSRVGNNVNNVDRNGGNNDPPRADDAVGVRNDVALLQETNAMLRRRSNDSLLVEITGPRGSPLYASGSFGDGRRVGDTWTTDLTMTSTAKEGTTTTTGTTVSLGALEDVEIRLGGVVIASALSHHVKARMDPTEWDGPSRKEVPCRFGGPVAGAWLPLHVDGWPRKHWSKMRDRYVARRRNEYRQDLDVFGALLEEVAEAFPRATVSFREASFPWERVERMAERLDLVPPTYEERGREEEEGRWEDVAEMIVDALRSEGNDDVGESLAERANEVQMAAYMMQTLNNGTKEAVEAEIRTLVRLQLDSPSTADFLSRVGMTYGISRLSRV